MKKKIDFPVDPLCLEQACEGVLLDLRCSCRQWAEHYAVPDDVLFAKVADRFILERARVPPMEAVEHRGEPQMSFRWPAEVP